MSHISVGTSKASANDQAREVEMPDGEQKGNSHLNMEVPQLANGSDAADRDLNDDEYFAKVVDLKKAIGEVFT